MEVREQVCPAVEAIAGRIRQELAGAAALRPGARGFLDGLWEALRVVAELRYAVRESTLEGAASAGWDVVDQWTAEPVAWSASRQEAVAIASEQGALNAAELRGWIERS